MLPRTMLLLALLALALPGAIAAGPRVLDCPLAKAEVLDDTKIRISWQQVDGANVYEVRRDPPPVPDGNPVVFTGGGPNFPNEFTEITNLAGVTLRYTVDAFGPGLARSRDCPALEVVPIPFFSAPGLVALALAGGLGSFALARRVR